MDDDEWERRVAEVWSSFDDVEDTPTAEAAFRAGVDVLVAELPAGRPEAPFERACAFDSTGHPDRAAVLYREALAGGLTGLRRRRATVQLASSLRNLGRSTESLALLSAELDAPSDELDDAVAGFLALALADVGREREAVSVALRALAPHLPRYQRSLGNYARLLAEETDRARPR